MNQARDERALQEAVIAALEGVGKDTGQAISALRHRAKMNRRMIRMLAAIGAVLAITIGVVVGVTINTVAQNAEIAEIQQRTSDKVLCPLYGAFLAAANNPVPDEIKNNPAQLREREEAFKIIRAGYDELGCGKT
jgi:hypothetical protein